MPTSNSRAAVEWAGSGTTLARPERTFNTGDPLEHGTDRRGVLLGHPQRHRRRVDRRARVQHRRWAVELAREVADNRHVLLPDRHLHGRVRVVAADHHRPAYLEHTRRTGAVGYHLQHLRWIETGFHREHERFGRRDIVDRHQKVRDELHLLPGAERPDVVVPARETFEYRNHP